MLYIMQCKGSNIGKIGISDEPLKRINGLVKLFNWGEVSLLKTYIFYGSGMYDENFLLKNTEEFFISDDCKSGGYTERRTKEGISKALSLMKSKPRMTLEAYICYWEIKSTKKIKFHFETSFIKYWNRKKQVAKMQCGRPKVIKQQYATNMLKLRALARRRSELRICKAIRISLLLMDAIILKNAQKACASINPMLDHDFYITNDFVCRWGNWMKQFSKSNFNRCTEEPLPFSCTSKLDYTYGLAAVFRNFYYIQYMMENSVDADDAMSIGWDSYWGRRLSQFTWFNNNFDFNRGRLSCKQISRVFQQINKCKKFIMDARNKDSVSCVDVSWLLNQKLIKTSN